MGPYGSIFTQELGFGLLPENAASKSRIRLAFNAISPLDLNFRFCCNWASAPPSANIQVCHRHNAYSGLRWKDISTDRLWRAEVPARVGLRHGCGLRRAAGGRWCSSDCWVASAHAPCAHRSDGRPERRLHGRHLPAAYRGAEWPATRKALPTPGDPPLRARGPLDRRCTSPAVPGTGYGDRSARPKSFTDKATLVLIESPVLYGTKVSPHPDSATELLQTPFWS